MSRDDAITAQMSCPLCTKSIQRYDMEALPTVVWCISCAATIRLKYTVVGCDVWDIQVKDWQPVPNKLDKS